MYKKATEAKICKDLQPDVLQVLAAPFAEQSREGA
jgi:hypothetical protein